MLIALIGEQGSGKDTVRKMIQYFYHTIYYKNTGSQTILSLDYYLNSTDEVLLQKCSGVIAKKFAQAPKEIVAKILNVPVTKWEDRDFKEEHRAKLVEFCETAKSIFGKGVWLKQALGDYINKPNQFLVIDDAGFTNELLAVKKYNGQIWRIKNKNVKESEQPRETESRAWTSVDQIIENNGSLKDLYDKVQEILSNTISTSGIDFQYGRNTIIR